MSALVIDSTLAPIDIVGAANAKISCRHVVVPAPKCDQFDSIHAKRFMARLGLIEIASTSEVGSLRQFMGASGCVNGGTLNAYLRCF